MAVVTARQKDAENYHKFSFEIQGYYASDLFTKFNVSLGDKCLDIGCGTGNISAKLLEKVGSNGKVYGFYPDKKRIDVAVEKYKGIENMVFAVGKLTDVVLEEKTFDLALCNAVFHWLTPQEKIDTINKVHHVLKKNGYFILNIMNDAPTNIVSIASHFLEGEFAKLKKMWHYHTEEEYRQIFANGGFDVILFENKTFKVPFQCVESYLKWIDATIYVMYKFKETYEKYQSQIKLCQFEDGTYYHESIYYQIVLKKK